ncbi:hypothetical protein [Sphingobacterium tabacisoli]|uniref:Uncharacterized protein n=1 Tax=Sphingobacterium tabacisoli TaxID=2044855 RepID=A0ABW5L3T1_9SPHI|nr:hypothetical protein [Sphingobacterium tabacisoli]
MDELCTAVSAVGCVNGKILIQRWDIINGYGRRRNKSVLYIQWLLVVMTFLNNGAAIRKGIQSDLLVMIA